jgi:hypothetical protein
MGTLKAAKKRGIITFEGQLLLKGSHDKARDLPLIIARAGLACSPFNRIPIRFLSLCLMRAGLWAHEWSSRHSRRWFRVRCA